MKLDLFDPAWLGADYSGLLKQIDQTVTPPTYDWTPAAPAPVAPSPAAGVASPPFSAPALPEISRTYTSPASVSGLLPADYQGTTTPYFDPAWAQDPNAGGMYARDLPGTGAFLGTPAPFKQGDLAQALAYLTKSPDQYDAILQDLRAKSKPSFGSRFAGAIPGALGDIYQQGEMPGAGGDYLRNTVNPALGRAGESVGNAIDSTGFQKTTGIDLGPVGKYLGSSLIPTNAITAALELAPGVGSVPGTLSALGKLGEEAGAAARPAVTAAKEALANPELLRLPGGVHGYGAGVQGAGEDAAKAAETMANLRKVQAAVPKWEVEVSEQVILPGRTNPESVTRLYTVNARTQAQAIKAVRDAGHPGTIGVVQKATPQSELVGRPLEATAAITPSKVQAAGGADEVGQAETDLVREAWQRARAGGVKVGIIQRGNQWELQGDIHGIFSTDEAVARLDKLAPQPPASTSAEAAIPSPTTAGGAEEAVKAGEAVPPSGVPESIDPVAKLTDLIKAAKPARRETEALKSAELSRRAGAVGGILEGSSASPRQRFQVAKGALRGQLPVAEFTAPELSFSPGEIDSLFTRVLDSGLRPFEKINTADALTKTLAGQIPTRGEMSNLEKVFGPDLIQAILDKRGLGAKVWENVIDLLNLPRSIATAFDASAPLRQGIITSVAHPIEAASSFKAMLEAMASEKGALAVEDAIQRGKFRDVMDSAGLYFAPMGKSATLSQREEAFMSRLAAKIPGIGASQRGYTTYLNKLRSDTFSTIAGNWERTGDLTPERARKLAGFLNVATGRGSLGKLERAGDILAIPFFAPRLVASRLQIPFKLIESDPFVRNLVARDLTLFVGTGMTALSMAKLAGAEVELDPRSTDFGRIKIGHTRLDFWGGLQPIARNMAQIITGERKAESGAIFDTSRKDQFLRFMRSKLSPAGGVVADLWTGKTFMGEDLQAEPGFIASQVASRFEPLFIQDVVQAATVDGVKGALLTTPSFFGASALTYTSPARDFQEAFSNATGKTWADMLDSERIPLVEQNPELAKAYAKWQDSREGTAAQIAKTKAEGLASIAELATTDPKAYREQASDIVTRAAIQRDFAMQAGLIKEGDYKQTPDQKAVDGYYEAVSPAFSELTTNYDLYDKLATNYLAGLPDEQRQKVLDEIAFSKDPTYRTLLQDRQKLQPYFNAPDQAYLLARKVADQTPEGSPQRLVLQFETLTDFRQAIETTLRKAGVPETEIPGGIAKVEASVGLSNLIDASRKIAIKTDPALILLLEKWGYGASKELRDFAAQQVGAR